jgi:phosphatidylinositol glycan class K
MLLLLLPLLLGLCGGSAAASNHTNNWAVIVDTSRFWFNYRHSANALALYRAVKQMGIPDSHIILMLADDAACNPRNVFPGTVYWNDRRTVNVYGDDVEVDYRGYEVTVESLIRILTGRHDADTPRNKRLLSDAHSNVLVYLTGHGGDEFIKFQDAEEINSQDLADAFEQMWQKRRYNEIFFVGDTCQAGTLMTRFYSPNIVGVGSSLKGENSYSHHGDRVTGVSVVDRFTYYLLDYFEQRLAQSEPLGTLHDLSQIFTYQRLGSHQQWRTDLYPKRLDAVPVSDFFGAVAQIEPGDACIAKITPATADAAAAAAAASDSTPPRAAERRAAPTTRAAPTPVTTSFDEAALAVVSTVFLFALLSAAVDRR